MGNTYGCDKCNVRKDWDNDIRWITTSYGLCDICYEKTSEEERKILEEKHE